MKRSLATSALALCLLVAGCGSDEGAGDTTTTTSATPTTTTTAAPGTTATTAPATTTTAAATTTTTAAPTTTTLAGAPVDFGPVAGDVLMVFGVAYDDVLNLRDGPGIAATILAGLDPLEKEVNALGNTRQLPQSFWYEVEVDGVTGWASGRFLFYEGSVDDITSAVVDQLGGSIPTADTMEALGLMVAESQSSTDPASDIVLSGAATVGDLGEVTYDVAGLGDDAVWGLRLHVFGQPDEGGTGFALKSVEATTICARGPAGNGLCP